jgi:hypothetical protein
MKRLKNTAILLYILGLVTLCIAERKTLFSWPSGIVTGNLLASAITVVPGIVHLSNQAKRHHREHMAKLDSQHKERMAVVRSAIRRGNGDRV